MSTTKEQENYKLYSVEIAVSSMWLVSRVHRYINVQTRIPLLEQAHCWYGQEVNPANAQFVHAVSEGVSRSITLCQA